ncbi:DMT family transporter [Paenibacillus sp. LHD-117]|uniref:DMT family transporter n=1 Tax=Paenibacillus sp. LHD-117 TaxID=3071412 RepID=UPI0027E04C08|nr:DMT family transporter [Paenibacillus sp. LHD-117]MDQ6418844.1 DMT family transporter [Paenibacillus sp. LHD-117]
MSNTATAIYSKGVKLAYLLAVINASVIGVSFLIVKLTLDYANPFDTLTFRFAAAFMILSIPVAFRLVKLKYRGKPLLKLLLLATMYPVGYFTLQVFGLNHASSVEGGIINAFTPVITMVLASAFLKEAITRTQKLSTLLSVFGVVFIFIMKGSSLDFSNLSGILLLLLAGLTFAAYSVLARSISRHFSPIEIAYFMVAVGFATALVISLIKHGSRGTLGDLVSPLASGTFLSLILFLGIVQLGTALMGSYILSQIEASKMAVFMNLSTVVSIAAGASILGESFTWFHLVGSVLIIAGVIGTNVVVRPRIGQRER